MLKKKKSTSLRRKPLKSKLKKVSSVISLLKAQEQNEVLQTIFCRYFSCNKLLTGSSISGTFLGGGLWAANTQPLIETKSALEQEAE